MGKPKTIHQYITELVPYMDAYAKLPGRPQKLKIVGSKVYWTQGKTQELYSVPLTAPTATPNSVISLPKTDETKQLTKEEEMLRERMRSRTEGMSSYEIRPSDDAVFYMEGVELCVFYPNGPRAGMAPLRVFDYMEEADRQKLASAGSVVKTCIQHVRHSVGECLHTTVGFVCNNNVFLARIHEQLEDSSKPLRVELEAITSSGTSDLQCGVADYIIQEEFRRFTGHYENERYAIIAITDSTKMRKVALLNEKEESGVETMPFPRVGDVNSTTAFIIRDHTDGSLRTLPLSAIRAHAPWAEYFPRFGFKSKDELYVTALSRTQEDYVVLSCPITALPTIKSEEQWCSEALAQVTVPEMKVEWKQQIPWAWVEVVAGLPIHFGSTHDVLVCHAAETETAHYHLYVRHAGSSHDAWKPLTMGTWNVVPSSLTIRNGRAYFLANADNRLTSVLYSVPLDASSPCDAAQLTHHSSLEEYVYSFVVADNDVCYVSSCRTEPAKIFIAQLSVAESQSTRTEIKCPAWIANATNPSSMGLISPSTYSFLGLTTTIPHIVTVKNRRGVPLSAHVFVSPMATARNAGPLAVFIYGGPHVQLVDEGNFDASCRGIVQVLLQNGISVAVVDNQMSNANGLRDFSVCKNNMGHFETHDYVDVVSYLCEAPKESGLPPQFCVDPNRVAIFGWSYGGYATLLAMCQAPNVFKIGFSGAPVGDWVLYDTGYTERYLGLLHSESEDGEKRHVREAYTSSAVAAFAKGFPEEINRVYIAHGLLDENVHFTNTMRVVEAMIQHEKPYQLLVYPGERHGLRQKVASRYHHDALLVKTLVEQL